MKKLLKLVPHRSVLDIPTGTGKMAPVLVELGSSVVACDISPAMLTVARRSYEEVGLRTVSYKRVDLLTASESLEKNFDVVLCIRLLHRVPQEVRSSMLSEIAKLGGFGIISVGIRNPYQEVRRVVRRCLLGGKDIGNEQRQTRAETDRLVSRTHRILARRAVFRGLSGEWIYLLERR